MDGYRADYMLVLFEGLIFAWAMIVDLGNSGTGQ